RPVPWLMRVSGARSAQGPSRRGSPRAAPSDIDRVHERVLAPEARRVVAAPHADAPEAEARVQRLGAGIARPHFEEQAPRAAAARQLERLAQQGAAVPAAL